MTRHRPLVAALGLFALFLPTAAEAQWYAAGYLGANHTHAADITIDQPAADTSLRFSRVTFEARPFESPQYYGIRIGRLLGERRRFGVEVEFIHLKVFAETAGSFDLSGRLNGAARAGRERMDAIVQRYSMTHGLNFLVINAVSRRPIGAGRVALVARAGAGPTIPHAESSIEFVSREQYEYAGPGIHAASGVDVQIGRRVSMMLEYKLTAARPRISVAGGTGRTTSISQHVAAGIALGFGD